MRSEQMRISPKKQKEVYHRILWACLDKHVQKHRLIDLSRASSKTFEYIINDLKALGYLAETIEHSAVQGTVLCKNPRLNIRIIYMTTSEGYQYLKREKVLVNKNVLPFLRQHP